MPNSTLHLGIFYRLQICDMGLTALLPLRRKEFWGFFRPEKSWWLQPALNPRTWVLKGSMLPLDRLSHPTGWYTVNGRRQLWDYTKSYIDSSQGLKPVQRACVRIHMCMGIIVAFICCQILCSFHFWHLENATWNTWIWRTIVISCNGKCHVHTVHYNRFA